MVTEAPKLFEGISETFDGLTKGLSELKDRVSLKEESALYKEFMSVGTSVDSKDVKEKSIGFMKAIGDVFNIDIPLFGTLGGAFGAKWPVDIFGNKEKRKQRKVINKLLEFFGVKGGLEELHRNYIDQNLKGIHKEFVKSAFQKYNQLEHVDSKKRDLWTAYGLETKASGFTDEQKNVIKSKLPDGDENLKTALSDCLDGDISGLNFNVSTINLVGQEYLQKDANNKVIGVDYQKIQDNKSKFINDYLNKIVPMLALSGNDFIASNMVNKETFALTVFGCLVGERYFMEGLNIGLIDVNEYKENISGNNNSAFDVGGQVVVGDPIIDKNSPEYLSEMEKRNRVMEQADLFVQKKVDYKWGGGRQKVQSGLDCSGLIIASMNNAGFVAPGLDSRDMFINIRDTKKLEIQGNGIKTLDNIKKGDILFWNSTNLDYKWSTGQIPKIRKGDADYRIHHVAFVKSIDYEKGKVVVVEANGSKGVVEREIDVKNELEKEKHKSELFVGSVSYSNLLAYNGDKKEVQVA